MFKEWRGKTEYQFVEEKSMSKFKVMDNGFNLETVCPTK